MLRPQWSSLGGYEHGLYAERWAPFVKVCLLSLFGGVCASSAHSWDRQRQSGLI